MNSLEGCGLTDSPEEAEDPAQSLRGWEARIEANEVSEDTALLLGRDAAGAPSHRLDGHHPSPRVIPQGPNCWPPVKVREVLLMGYLGHIRQVPSFDPGRHSRCWE